MREVSQTGELNRYQFACQLRVNFACQTSACQLRGQTGVQIPLEEKIDSSDICGTSTLVTYFLNFIARQDICTKCLKFRKIRYWQTGTKIATALSMAGLFCFLSNFRPR